VPGRLRGATALPIKASSVVDREKPQKAVIGGTSSRIVGLDFAGFRGVWVDFLAKSKSEIHANRKL
jgi:hypothetical protein